MAYAQNLASALRPTLPSHAIVTRPSGPQTQRKTLQSNFLAKISAYPTINIIPIDEYEQIYKKIRTQAVQEVICIQPPNPIIQTQPTTVDPMEKTLPRVHRTALSQLRSGFSKALNSYQSRLDPSKNGACPDCSSGASPTTNHLVNCLAGPMELDVRNHSLRPDRFARFVSSYPCFYQLP